MSVARHWLEQARSLPPSHPLQISARTYALAISLTLAPSLLTSLSSKDNVRAKKSLQTSLTKNLGLSGLPISMLLAFGGSACIEWVWEKWHDVTAVHENRRRLLSPQTRTFLSALATSFIAFQVLQRRRPTVSDGPLTKFSSKVSPTLDLTLLLAVRALDAIIQSRLQLRFTNNVQRLGKVTNQLDSFVFWAASSRIMWCWFYQPERLPKSYVKWISSLAEISPQLLSALQSVRKGDWTYGQPLNPGAPPLTTLATQLGYPASWGDPLQLPPKGGKIADAVWEKLGVVGRSGVGGLPCEIVHSGVAGNSCTAHALTRGFRTFGKAILIYLPVHLLPILLRNPARIVLDPQHYMKRIIRSATFLSAFVSSIWFTICMCRTLLIARLFPEIPHQYLDGPWGGVFLGTLVCGTSIWLEAGKRRGEIALYVSPRALRACLPDNWVRSGNRRARFSERLVFIFSLATLWTTARHNPQYLRGLSRWTLNFIRNGWRFRRLDRGGQPSRLN